MAAAFDGSVTPPPPTGVRTPPTPRLGFQDHWEPFTPRKSARISSQRASNRTPSPSSAHRQPLQSPRTAKKTSKQSKSNIASPMPSPQKKRMPALDMVRRATDNLHSQGSRAAGPSDFAQRLDASSVSRAGGMLPTPSKTPQKPPSDLTAADIKSFARNLFSSESADLATPNQKRTKKYTGASLESFAVEEVEDPIEIFTDSRDRVPTKDRTGVNPFYGDAPAPPEPSKRRSKRRQVNVPGEGAQTVEEASGREDGMVYVFRGKKFFRKFSEYEAEDQDESLEDADDEAHLSRPLTRAAIKPRLLFHSPKTEAMIEEEEAATDVEDQEEEEELPAIPETPSKPYHHMANTPEAPKFAPVSPPDTRRVTRSANKLPDLGTPLKGYGQRSPFDSWRRTKEHTKDTTAKKRQGESLTSEQSKRARI